MSIEVVNVCKDNILRVKFGGIYKEMQFLIFLLVFFVVKLRIIQFVFGVFNGWKYGLFKLVFVYVLYVQFNKGYVRDM